MSSIHHLIDNDLRTKNEFQLTDALMHMIQSGVKMSTFNVENWFDCGKKDALLSTNSIMLSKLGNRTPDDTHANTIIIPPVSIGEGATVKNCVIGPNVSIGKEAQLYNCIISESIIGPGAELENAILHDSLVGNQATIRVYRQSVNIGDSTIITYE